MILFLIHMYMTGTTKLQIANIIPYMVKLKLGNFEGSFKSSTFIYILIEINIDK